MEHHKDLHWNVRFGYVVLTLSQRLLGGTGLVGGRELGYLGRAALGRPCKAVALNLACVVLEAPKGRKWQYGT